MRAKTFSDVWKSIDVRGESECWPYMGAINHSGGTFNGERRWNAKLRAHQVDEIRWLGSLGLAASEIAPLYRVCNQTVQNVIARRRYA